MFQFAFFGFNSRPGYPASILWKVSKQQVQLLVVEIEQRGGAAQLCNQFKSYFRFESEDSVHCAQA